MSETVTTQELTVGMKVKMFSGPTTLRLTVVHIGDAKEVRSGVYASLVTFSDQVDGVVTIVGYHHSSSRGGVDLSTEWILDRDGEVPALDTGDSIVKVGGFWGNQYYYVVNADVRDEGKRVLLLREHDVFDSRTWITWDHLQAGFLNGLWMLDT